MNKTGYKYELDTPCLILNMDLLENNLAKMQHSIESAGKAVRPHAKPINAPNLLRNKFKPALSVRAQQRFPKPKN